MQVCKEEGDPPSYSRDRTVHELRTRLVADYDETVVDDVLAYLREMDFVNDERFARNCRSAKPPAPHG